MIADQNTFIRISAIDVNMSQEQPKKVADPITYGDIFDVSGNLAAQPVAPHDAALMQSAETRSLGQTQKGGVAAAMQTAAELNERSGYVKKDVDTIVGSKGMGIIEISVPGSKITTEYIAGQPVQFESEPMPAAYLTADSADIKIGEALEAAALGAGDKPVDQSDAAAIQSAERRATGMPETMPGGVAAAAQAAADVNPRLPYDERTTLEDVLSSATRDLLFDKAVTMEDARKIQEIEARHSGTGQPFPGGVGDTMEAAALVNQREGSNIL